MASSPPKTVKTSLYRLAEITGLEEALIDDALGPKSAFDRADVLVGGREALLVTGATHAPSKWARHVQRLTEQVVNFTNSTPRAVLIVRDDADEKTAWALTWGLGHFLLDTVKIDFGFGSGIIARSAVSSEIKSITKTVLDHRARVDRSTLPVGSNIHDFGLDGFGEVVSRIEAKARIAGLTVGDGVIVLTAADSLKIPLATDPTQLIADLTTIKALRDEDVLPGLESLEQLVALKPKDAVIPTLEAALIARLRGEVDHAIALSWPHEQLEIFGPAMSCKITGFGDRQRRVLPDPPDTDTVIGWFAGLSVGDVERRLDSITLQLFGEAEPAPTSVVSSKVALRRWIALEVREGASRYCLHNGKWFRMDDNYLARIDDRVREILQLAGPALPAWPPSEQERPYNERAAAALGGVRIDRTYITTPLHRRGIEPCDIYLHPGDLIHVKRGRDSAELSHLLAQALVASDSLARDESARQAWGDRVLAQSNGTVSDAVVRRVVLGIGRAEPLDADSLFTFTKVNLASILHGI